MYNTSQRSPIYIISISTTLLTQASFSMLIVQARKIVEDVPGVDEAEIHLELADESKIKSKKRINSRKSKRAVPTGTASDKIVNASNMKSAASPQTTTDEEDMYGDVGRNRNRLAKSTIPRRPPMIDTSSHTESDDENMYADDFDQEDLDVGKAGSSSGQGNGSDSSEIVPGW